MALAAERGHARSLEVALTAEAARARDQEALSNTLLHWGNILADDRTGPGRGSGPSQRQFSRSRRVTRSAPTVVRSGTRCAQLVGGNNQVSGPAVIIMTSSQCQSQHTPQGGRTREMAAGDACYRCEMVVNFGRQQGALVVLATFLGTWLLGSVYAFASPIGTSPDEPAHWRHAYAVHTGQDTSDAMVEVPAPLTVWPGCTNFRPDVSAECVESPPEQPAIASVNDPLHGAPTLYYSVVGWPLAQWPDERGILAGRVVSALVSALLWAIAIAPWTGARHWPARLAVILTAAPAAVYFSGTIQPSGMEIASLAALWSLSFAVFEHMRSGAYRSLPSMDPGRLAAPRRHHDLHPDGDRMVCGCRAVGSLAMVRGVTPPIAAGSPHHGGSGVFVAAAATLRTVSLLIGPWRGNLYGVGVGAPAPDVSLVARVVSLATRMMDDPVRAIGLMGWVDTQVPAMATMIWFLMAGGIAFMAAPFLQRRHLVALGALLRACWEPR